MQTWKYLLEEVTIAGSSEHETLEQLDELGDGGWEAVAVWPKPGPNQAGKFYVLFKQPKSK